ncbi:MAG: uridine kinase [Acidobacteria bacterium]|nr:uridine kinase [Acidobacteriota bacterium]
MIGIAGPSGAGKTALAVRVAEELGGAVLSLDHYYCDLKHLPLEERAQVNFDDPASLDWDLAVEQLAALRRGEAILRPVYDFATHTRTASSQPMEPGRALIVDGIFALVNPAVWRLYDVTVFVELEDRVCLARRMERDIRERGRTRESVLRQYAETVRPMCERHVLPTRARADVIVRGDQPVERSVHAILAAVRERSTIPVSASR